MSTFTKLALGLDPSALSGLRSPVLLAMFAAFVGCSSSEPSNPGAPQPAPQPTPGVVTNDGGAPADAGAAALVDGLLVALGGREAILGSRFEKITSKAQRFDPGEAKTPGTARLVSDLSLRELTAFGDRNTAATRTRADFGIDSHFPGPARFDFTEVRVAAGGYVSGLDNFFAVGSSPPPSSIPSSRAVAADKHSDLFSPLRLIRSALAGGGELRSVPGAADHVRVVRAGKSDVELVLDLKTSLPTKAVTLENHPPLGDTPVEVSYADYRKAGALTLPFEITLRLDGLVAHTEHRSAIDIDAAPADDPFVFPAGVTAGPENAAEAAFGERSAEWLRSFGSFGLPLFYGLQEGAPSTPEMVAPGVYVLKGPSHHSLLIEMSDHLILVEAPLYDEWTTGVLATVKTISSKPLTKVISTHFHYDHSGGVREVLAAGGATLYTAAAAAPFFEELLTRPHTVRPDRFSKSSPKVSVLGVAASQTLTDSAGRIVELRVVPNSHADGMLAVYLPQEKLVFEADLFSPGFPNAPDTAAELYDAIQAQSPQIEKIVGAHGFGAAGPTSASVATMADLKQAANR